MQAARRPRASTSCRGFERSKEAFRTVASKGTATNAERAQESSKIENPRTFRSKNRGGRDPGEVLGLGGGVCQGAIAASAPANRE